MSCTFPTTRDPAPIANRVSVVAGVSDTIRWGSPLIVTGVPSSSVSVSGKDGADVAGPDVGRIEVAPGSTVGALDGEVVQPAASSAMATSVGAIRKRRGERGVGRTAMGVSTRVGAGRADAPRDAG